MPDPIYDTTTPLVSPCDIVNQNAQVQRTMLQDVSTPSNGLLRKVRGNATFVDVAAPYYADLRISGLDATLAAPPNALRVDVTAGSCQRAAELYTLASASSIVLANGDATNARIDVVGLNSSNVLQVVSGTPAAVPLEPALPADFYPLASVWVAALATGAAVGAYLTTLGTGREPIRAGQVQGQLCQWDDTAKEWRPVTDATLVDGADISLGTTTGTRIGTQSTQKVGFLGATPIVRQPVVDPGSFTDLTEAYVAWASLVATIENFGLIDRV